MCGIVGYLDRTGAPSPPLGERLLRMLDALACRGPDSSGAAIWGPGSGDLIVRVKALARPDPASEPGGDRHPGPHVAPAARTAPGSLDSLAARDGRDMLAALERAGRGLGRIRARARQGDLVRLEIATERPTELARAIEAVGTDVEVVSMGRRLEVVKQVGAPRNLDAEFGLSRMPGTHGIGHTRLSTESRVDLSHSQPFWAHGMPDLAIVHNGHITNYHRLRRVYEQEGVRFYTENDSEIVAVHLGRSLAAGAGLRAALEASIRELDGSFSILAATATELGFAKDRFCLKPLIVGENESALAIANEEVALQAAFASPYAAREAGAGTVAVWTVPAGTTAPAGAREARRARRPARSRRAA